MDKADTKTKLVLGSAGKSEPDAVTLDIDPEHHPDVIHDLNKIPYPFADDAFEQINCHHVLEHLENLPPVMAELHRICKKDGEIFIEVPHHSSWCANTPHHKLRFNWFGFDDYLQDEYTWLTGNKFHLIKKEITFHRAHRRLFCTDCLMRVRWCMNGFGHTCFPPSTSKYGYAPLKSRRRR